MPFFISAIVFIASTKALEVIYSEKWQFRVATARSSYLFVGWKRDSRAHRFASAAMSPRQYACKWQNRSRLRAELLIYLFIYWPRRHIALMSLCARRCVIVINTFIYIGVWKNPRPVPQRKRVQRLKSGRARADQILLSSPLSLSLWRRLS